MVRRDLAVRLAGAIILGGSLLGAGAAFGAHPTGGRVYSGRVTEPDIVNGGTAHPRIAFRVSKSGKTMRLKGHAVFSQSCPGGGGSVGLGSKRGDLVPPRVKINRKGRFSGSKAKRYHYEDGSTQTIHYGFKGKFAKHGRRATGYFWYGEQSGSCPFRNAFKLHRRSE